MGSGASKPPPKPSEQTESEINKGGNSGQEPRSGQSSNPGVSGSSGSTSKGGQEVNQGTRKAGAPVKDNTVKEGLSNQSRQGDPQQQRSGGQPARNKMEASSGPRNTGAEPVVSSWFIPATLELFKNLRERHHTVKEAIKDNLYCTKQY